MESLSRYGRAGTGIRDSTSMARDLFGVRALESTSLADSVGVGGTGDSIGATTTSFSIITVMFPTAEFSQIANTLVGPADFTGRADFMERTDSTAADQEDSLAAMDSPVTSMGSQATTDSLHLIARLV